MKEIITAVYLFFSFAVSAQKNAAADTTAGPVITKAGKSEGEKTEINVTKNEGGSIKSSDGKIELIIPEGAVSKKTLITIEPVTNLLTNGSGKAYHLAPSGIQFEKPLQLILHYDEEEIKDSTQLLLGIAMQDESGQWFGLKEFSIDTIAKTISGNINHFSTWAAFEKLKLVTWPQITRLKVKQSALLAISGVDGDNRTPKEKQDDESKMSPEELQEERNYENRFKEKYGNDVYISPLRKRRKPGVVYWYVNGVMGGNEVTGTLSTLLEDGDLSKYNVYTAPDKVPDQNPVTITARLVGTDFSVKGVRFPSPGLTTSILIYDSAVYEIKMELVAIGGGKGVWGGITTRTDEGSFYLSLDIEDPKIMNIQNRMEKMKNNCRNVLLNPTTCTGLLHVAGAKEIKVTPANPPGQPYPIVEIWFVPFPVEISRVKFDCPSPNKRGGNSIGVHPLMRIGRALPFYLKFVAKDEKQIITDSSGDDGSLKIWVQKVKDN